MIRDAMNESIINNWHQRRNFMIFSWQQAGGQRRADVNGHKTRHQLFNTQKDELKTNTDEYTSSLKALRGSIKGNVGSLNLSRSFGVDHEALHRNNNCMSTFRQKYKKKKKKQIRHYLKFTMNLHETYTFASGGFFFFCVILDIVNKSLWLGLLPW